MITLHKLSSILISLIIMFSLTCSSFAPVPVSAQGTDGLKRLVNTESGRVSFIGPENGRIVSAPKVLGTFIRPPDPAFALANRFAPEFGIQDPVDELSEIKTSRSEDGRVIVRYQQEFQGIPIMGGELIVNTNQNGDLYSMNGEVSPDLSLPTQPKIDSAQARDSALQALAKWYQKTSTDFIVSEPELWIFDESLLQASTRPVELVWRMEVTAADNSMPVRELVLVNAQRGGISLHFNQIDPTWESAQKETTKSTLNTASSNLPSLSLKSNSGLTTITSVAGYSPALAPVTWYVATTGSDASSCSSTGSPCQTINGGIGKAAVGDIVKVAIGTYTGTGTEVVYINKDITLSGGWNATFTTQNGKSTIDGENTRRGIYLFGLPGATALIESFIIQRGSGAGVSNNGATLTLNNSIVTNNTGGGGVWSGGMLTINNSVISNNNTNGQGGGIDINGGTAIVNNTVVKDNVSYSYGGGIYNGSALTLNNSTVSANIANDGSGTDGGGGIFNGGALTINNSTISGNTALGVNGGGILNGGTLLTNNATIINNKASSGGGLDMNNGSATLQNTILSGNNANSTPDCSGTVGSSGYNIIGSTSGCTFTPATGDQINVNPQLGTYPIGSASYHALLSGSPAIDAGNSATCLATDQRGITRPQGSACDIGAYEYKTPGSATSFGISSGNNQKAAPSSAFASPLVVYVVDSSGSPVSGVTVTFTAPGSGASGTFANSGTNVTTVSTNSSGVAFTSTVTANSQSGNYNVTATASGLAGSVNFALINTALYVAVTGNDSNSCTASAAPCLTINGAIGKAVYGDTIRVATGTYTGSGTEVVLINKSVMLSGGWNSGFSAQSGMSTINAQSSRRGVQVASGSVVVERFIIQNGSASDGGGILNSNSATLTLNNTAISSNTVTSQGAGILNNGNLTIINSVVSSNTAIVPNGTGGGIWNAGGLTLNNSTVSNNSSAWHSGGIYNQGIVTVSNSTISNNSSAGMGGIYNDSSYGSGIFNIRNSILSNNTAGATSSNCTGNISSLGYNLLGNNSGCTFSTSTGDLVGTSAAPINPRLSPLQNNGGPTFTHALIAGSPAINVGNPASPGSGGSACLATDQRGVSRPVDSRCDIGAYEGSIPFVPAPLVNTYTAGSTASLPGTFLCNQTQPNCTNNTNPHADAAHKYAIGTYNFYASKFNRDSINNNGMVIKSTVQYCDPDFPCPYDNAFWSGTQMVYGSAHGFANADDIVAHELTHGVTQYESNLFYYYQSGAINESISDTFGEYYDQTNGLGNDTAGVKWLLGEDTTGLGAIRSMSNPPAYSDPDKMSSPLYIKAASDSGGIHSNSGINNKAVYLMVDGGTFNSITVVALGWEKTGAIYYEANTNLLSSGADYSDLYYALQQACTNLIGQKSITAGDCIEVKDAMDAVEMNLQPAPNFNTDAPLCIVAGTLPSIISFADNLETGASNWTINNGIYTRWQYNSPYGAYAHSGAHFLYADDYPAAVTDATAKLISVLIPPNAYLHFAHAYAFETGPLVGNPALQNFDGGVLEYSNNAGASWQDAGSLIDYNGYKGTIYSGFGNPLATRAAFVGSSHGYISTRLNLASLAGQTITFRWRMGLDDIGFGDGWWLDDVQVYSCSVTLKGNAGVAGATLAYTENGPKSVQADGSGNYTISVPSGWTGTVTPKKIGYQFTPANKSYSNVQSNQTAQNYTASVCPTCADKDTVGVFRPSNGALYLRNLNITGFADVAINYGLGGDYPVVGDWDGDGDDTIGVYRNGTFLLRNSNSVGFANITVAFGSPGDQPIAGDWNNDGVDTIGVYRSSTGTFLLRNSNTPGPADLTFALGNVGDVGIAGDWNGDGTDTTGVFRPSNGVIFLKNTNASGFADIALNYGLPGDQPVVGDWDNNGTTTIGIYRNARFYLRNSNTNGFANIQLDLGNVGDMPIAGNWDAKP